MFRFLEYLGIILIGSGLLLLGINGTDPEYWCLMVGIGLYVKFGGEI